MKKCMCWCLSVIEMELTLVQLTQQIDELFDAMQYALQGKLPIKLFNPVAFSKHFKKCNF